MQSLRRLLFLLPQPKPLHSRTLTTSPLLLLSQNLPPRPVIPDADITESFLKGTGPGGQKINKTSSAVQLKHLPTGLVIKCQETRSRSQNRKIARRILAERIEVLELGEQSRVKVKEEKERRKKASKGKKARRKYRKIGEGKEGQVEEKEEEDEEDADGREEHVPELDGVDKASATLKKPAHQPHEKP